jgi:hypothetical protein
MIPQKSPRDETWTPTMDTSYSAQRVEAPPWPGLRTSRMGHRLRRRSLAATRVSIWDAARLGGHCGHDDEMFQSAGFQC